MANSKIEWTDSTWNPVTGCRKTSAGCLNCYAERMSKRLKAMGQANYANGFEVTMHPHVIEHPLKWKKAQVIFVNSMSDLFHEDVPLEFIRQIFDVMTRADWHTFQILTKRSKRLEELAPLLEWPKNVWMGVTVENASCAYRIEHLCTVPAAVRFLSMEPLLSAVDDMNLDGIDWVIVGGESGPGARLIQKQWVYGIRKQCREAKVPFFFKQWGGINKKKAGRELDSRIYDEMPEQPWKYCHPPMKKTEWLAREVAMVVNAGKAWDCETVDFSNPNRPPTCLEVDFPILPINQIAAIEGNAGKPIYQMSKWWARRCSSVFRAMLITAAMKAPEDPSEAAKQVWDAYYGNHQKKGAFKHLKVADIFMGGSTTVVEGSRLGMQMYGNDLNPVAWFVVKNEMAKVENAEVKAQIMPFYACDCPCGHKGKWTKVGTGEVMGDDFEPTSLCPEEHKEYSYEGP